VNCYENAMFVVFEDLADATDTKVHDANCHYYLNRKKDATTVRWHGPFALMADAVNLAQSISDRKCQGVTLRPACCLGRH